MKKMTFAAALCAGLLSCGQMYTADIKSTTGGPQYTIQNNLGHTAVIRIFYQRILTPPYTMGSEERTDMEEKNLVAGKNEVQAKKCVTKIIVISIDPSEASVRPETRKLDRSGKFFIDAKDCLADKKITINPLPPQPGASNLFNVSIDPK